MVVDESGSNFFLMMMVKNTTDEELQIKMNLTKRTRNKKPNPKVTEPFSFPTSFPIRKWCGIVSVSFQKDGTITRRVRQELSILPIHIVNTKEHTHHHHHPTTLVLL